ncbi:O-succinylbenzoic acid--CoA ligase [Nocardiopsis mwathae]|uniref:O-succinylbenzoic acid--CoA ligase n=1 Tax=Nocardiopsis mwathae TaxID=1472723 RepID=A0A7W9YFZ0_9ACTN|nr:O-succinylbenzoic acid--CoA ligase [Nocardiopsis mwathae]
MANRPLQAVTGLDPAHLTSLLAEALAGRGPALLPIDPGLPPARVDALLTAMRADRIRSADGVRSLPGGDGGVADDTALVIATSGSTGVPKGVELSADALLHSARASIRRIGAAPDDAWLCVLPTAHISGLQVVLRALVGGTEPVHRAFDPADTMAVAAAHRPHVSLVPTQLHRLLAADADLSLFGTILLGGAAADEGLLERARAAGGRLITTYGMSETCGGCVYDGVPLDGMRADLDGEGRILLAGPALFSGYRLDPEHTAAHLLPPAGRRGDERWFRTGDLGRFDEEGRLRVRGRADDMINTGGHKVVPGEVAALVARHPAVAEAVVVGRADPEWGQRVTAVVVPTDPACPPSLDDLRQWVKSRLPGYAAPRELDLRARIPLLGSGKPDLSALRASSGHSD